MTKKKSQRFVLRVWLPDRPGALGRVASAIGSVGASLIGIDILEQEGGYAIDELIVDAVDSPNASEKLVVALTFIEGVNVEDIRISTEEVIDPRVDALETAAELVDQRDVKGVLEVFMRRAQRDMSADWATIMQLDEEEPLMSSGNVPSIPWVKAFVMGTLSSAAANKSNHGPEDIAWASLTKTGGALVLGRDGRPFRARERRQLSALARIADTKCAEMQANER